MNESCFIIPPVKDSNGEYLDSKLYLDIFKYVKNRDKAIDIYLRMKNPEFDRRYGEFLNKDEYGEYILSDIMKYPNISLPLFHADLIKKLNEDTGYYDSDTNTYTYIEDTIENRLKLAQQVNNFNDSYDNSKIYTAVIIRHRDEDEKYIKNIDEVRKSDKNFITVKIMPTTSNTLKLASSIKSGSLLYNRLTSILSSANVRISAYNELLARYKTDGVVDWDAIHKSTYGIIDLIKISNNEEGIKALPEEVAHFAVAANRGEVIVERLINLFKNNEALVQEVIGEDYYDIYKEHYGNSKDKLAEEAVGKLIGLYLLNKDDLKDSPYQGLFNRVINKIKNTFSNINQSEIEKALSEVQELTEEFSTQLLAGKLLDADSIKKIKSSYKGTMMHVSSEEASNKRRLDIINRILQNEYKRLKILRDDVNKEYSYVKYKTLINDLENSIVENETLKAIEDYIEQVLKDVRYEAKYLEDLNLSDFSKYERGKLIRNIKHFLDSYQYVTKDLHNYLNQEKALKENTLSKDTERHLNEISGILSSLYGQLLTIEKAYYIKFTEPFVKDGLKLTVGRNAGKTLMFADLVENLYEDIPLTERWFSSMSDSSDDFLKVADQIRKRYDEYARQQTIKDLKEVEKLFKYAKDNGMKNYDWMFERDSKGNFTTDYLHKVDFERYERDLKRVEEEYKTKYNKRIDYYNALRKWRNENRPTFEDPKKYVSDSYKNLSEVQKKIYDRFMILKHEADLQYPKGIIPGDYNRVMIRKDIVDRIKSSTGIISGASEMFKAVKDNFIRRSDDDEFGSDSNIGFDGKIYNSLPIKYTRLMKGESPNDLSTDIFSTLSMYIYAANYYNKMSYAVDALEIGKDILANRKMYIKSGGKQLKESLGDPLNAQQREAFISSQLSNALQRYNDYMEMQVYQRYHKDEGTVLKKADVAKTVDTVRRINSVVKLAGNTLSALANVGQGVMMLNIEAVAKEFFEPKDLAKADAVYTKNIASYAANIGSRIRNDKLYLWCEKLNVTQDFDEKIRNLDFNKNSWIVRIFGRGFIYWLQSAGDHWLYTRTSLALANTIKLHDSKGNKYNLWDAMHVFKNDSKSPATIGFKTTMYKEDGTEFTDDDLFAFINKSAEINKRCFGAYSTAERMAAQKTSIGRLAFQFRQYLVTNLTRRFEAAKYNYNLQSEVEGYYRTSWRFLKNIASELRHGQFNLISNYRKLNRVQKSNVNRAMAELVQVFSLYLLITLIDWNDDDDETNDSWIWRTVDYLSNRLYTETAAFTPTTALPFELVNLLDSPIPSVNLIQDIIDLVNIINPTTWRWNEEAILKTGPYKGYSEAERNIIKVLPFINNMKNLINPENVTTFFKK